MLILIMSHLYTHIAEENVGGGGITAKNKMFNGFYDKML